MRDFVIVGVGGFVLAGLVGCSGASVDPVSAYAADFDRARTGETSPFILEVLKDGKVTAEEYRNAHRQHIACVEKVDPLIEVEYTDSEGLGFEYVTVYDVTPLEEKTVTLCQRDWVGPIDELYTNQVTNPNNGDMNALIAACLVRKGLAPKGFTGKDYSTVKSQVKGATVTVEVSDPDAMGSSDGDPNAPGYTEGWGDVDFQISGESFTADEDMPVIPGGASLADRGVMMCEMNPQK